MAETITVSGAAPVVDATSTTTRTQLTRETLEVIPTGRNSLVALMLQAPGARPQLDWSFTTGNPFYKVFGQLGEQWVGMEGVVTSGPKTGTQGGNHYDYAAIEESMVTTLGNTAEALTRGMQINVILKSGGNDYHGTGYYSHTGRRLEFENVDAALLARGIGAGDAVTPSVSDQFQYFHTGKLSYQMTPANKLVGFVQYVRPGGEGTNGQLATYDSRTYSPTQATTSKIEWQLVQGNRFLSVQTGAWIWVLSRSTARARRWCLRAGRSRSA